LKLRSFIPLLIIAAGIGAYHNSLHGPFIFDDCSFAENPAIRHLWPLWQVLMGPHQAGMTVQGRPVISLSFAINYAINGLRVWGYHAVNLAIHIAAGLVLFGIARRTLLQPPLRQRFGMAARPLALLIAVIWVVHPLQTESVTYMVQRAESMMGLFYLLTLYCVIRGAESDSPRLWYVLSVASCLLGMASKEVMVSAPLIVLLYDRTFLGGSFAEAWRRRWRLYLALAATWVLLAYLVVTTGTRGGTVGIGTGVAWQSYALTQLQAIPHYLRLSLWPHPLVFDYGTGLVSGLTEVLSGALIVTVMLLGALVALRRWPSVGFLGVWFFAILAPTSSVVPVASQTIAEHRMYLPLAAVIAVVVVGAFALGKRVLRDRQGVVLGCVASATVVTLFSFFTIQRNRDYRSALTIWQDTTEKCPDNSRAHNNLGAVLDQQGKVQEAIGHYEQALRLKPDYAEAHYNLGIDLMGQGRLPEAIGHYERALQIRPNYAEAYNNLGFALMKQGKVPEAIAHYEQAVRLKPDDAEMHNNLAFALAHTGQVQDAIGHYEQALQLNPNYAEAHNNLGVALVKQGRLQEAIDHYKEAVRIKPDYASAQCNWGNALLRGGNEPEAIGHYEQALEINPDLAEGYYSLGLALEKLGRTTEAVQHYQQALRIKPDFVQARDALARVGAVR